VAAQQADCALSLLQLLRPRCAVAHLERVAQIRLRRLRALHVRVLLVVALRRRSLVDACACCVLLCCVLWCACVPSSRSRCSGPSSIMWRARALPAKHPPPLPPPADCGGGGGSIGSSSPPGGRGASQRVARAAALAAAAAALVAAAHVAAVLAATAYSVDAAEARPSPR
jgi:hypothetical protein